MAGSFKEDIQSFITLINSSQNQAEIKKMYIQLVKKYHPDSAPEAIRPAYNEYMIVLNKVFAEGKSSVQEVQIEKQTVPNVQKNQNQFQQKKVYTVVNYFGKTQQYTDYLEYIFHLGKEEFESGRMTMSYGQDYYDYFTSFSNSTKTGFNKQSEIKNCYDAMKHFYNAAKCFTYILTNHPDYIYADYIAEELQKVQVLNNNLSRSMALSNSKELTER